MQLDIMIKLFEIRIMEIRLSSLPVELQFLFEDLSDDGGDVFGHELRK